MKRKLALIGGGGHCRSCIDVIMSTDSFNLIGVFDPNRDCVKHSSLSWLGNDERIESFVSQDVWFLITIGQLKTPKLREQIYSELVSLNANIATVVSPRAYVSGSANIEPGTIIMHDALVNANAKVGKNCIINSKSLIEHDAIVGDHCHISTGAIVNGGSSIDDGCFIGSGAVVVQQAMVGKNSFVKAKELRI